MMNLRSLALACAVLTIPAALAAPSPAFQQAILAELDQATRTEVQRRATGGNSVYEVLAITLLNNLQLANATGARVVAIDFGREVAVVEQAGQPLRVISFNAQTLTIRP
jgi:hypothetical protein